mmetsp:Transcript_95404/g.199603  ORF Transcript_95404/g.199603 Transcript_95404/m.199603 type:complete len:623 (-) Transcript_95404:268-2136(-)
MQEDGTTSQCSERATSFGDFKPIKLLGEGAFSAVYKVQRIADGQVYALKNVNLPSLSAKEKKNALNEIRLLASVQHENIISYKEAFFDDDTKCLCIVTECADGGDLLQQITKCQQQKTFINENDLWRYFFGMVFGLKELHSKRILHRDIKSANIFLGTGGKNGRLIAKLGDFNVSTVAKRGLCMTQTGTPYYASPEVWRDMPYDGKSDIWSLGAVLYEACALHPPFQAKDMEGLYRKVLRGQYPPIPSHYSKELSGVIAEMLQVNARYRPSASEMLLLPFVQKRAQELGVSIPLEGTTDLLSTIKVPRNVIDLSSYLPVPQYERSTQRSQTEARSTAEGSAFSAGPLSIDEVSMSVAAGGSACSRDSRETASRPPKEPSSALPGEQQQQQRHAPPRDSEEREGQRKARRRQAASRSREPEGRRHTGSAQGEDQVVQADIAAGGPDRQSGPKESEQEAAAPPNTEAAAIPASKHHHHHQHQHQPQPSASAAPAEASNRSSPYEGRLNQDGGSQGVPRGRGRQSSKDSSQPRRNAAGQQRRNSAASREASANVSTANNGETAPNARPTAAGRDSSTGRVRSSSRLPKILPKDASRPVIAGCGAPALPKLPRILSSPHRLPVAAA